MKASRQLILLFLAACVIPVTYAGKPPRCTDYRLSWEFDDGVPSMALGSDGQGLYTDGAQGVSATGYMCNGGYDATLNTIIDSKPLTRPQRFLYLNFNDVLNETSCTPAVREVALGGYFLNVRNLLNPDHPDTFTTNMMGYLRLSGAEYTLRLNPGGSPVVNDPYTTSLVEVKHIRDADERFEITPLPSGSSNPEAIASTPVSSLMSVPKPNVTLNCGQFVTPFKITIRVLQP